MSALYSRIERLIHPTFGIKRDIDERVDRNDKLISVSVGEIREVHAVLVELARSQESAK